MAKVLILAREEVVAALLGLMVEVSGFEPRFADGNETAETVIKSEHPHAVLIDCDHPELSKDLIEVIRTSGARSVLFSPRRMQSEVTRLASQHGANAFTLPIEPEVFIRILKS
ncbi:MAG TPA: hypothetical protein VGN73_07790 [Gemmatimonadaceae bacterium]|nr:hypothetical protein [Gemmatimonadaceae bacterium]